MGLKLKDLMKAVRVGTSIGAVVAPGGVGEILKAVNSAIDDKSDPQNEGALRELAKVNEQQSADIQDLTTALFAMHERLSKLEGK